MNKQERIKKAMALKEQLETLKAAMKHKKLQESRSELEKLFEGEMERATIIFNVKEMGDKLNKMVDDLAKMQADVLKIGAAMKGVFGPDLADKFSQAAKQAIESAFESIGETKGIVDTNVQQMEGKLSDEDVGTPSNDMLDAGTDAPEGADTSSMDEPTGDDAETPAPADDEAELDDLLGGADAAAGPKDEPLGRKAKESAINTGKALTEEEDGESEEDDDDEHHFVCKKCGYTWDSPARWDECPECGIEVEGTKDIAESLMRHMREYLREALNRFGSTAHYHGLKARLIEKANENPSGTLAYLKTKISEDWRATFNKGDRVRVCHGSGCDSNKVGIIVDPSEVKTDTRGVPTNVQGSYKPVDWNQEVAIRLDDGSLITMYKNRLLGENQEVSEGSTPLNTCRKCGCYIDVDFGADSPAEHSDASGTEDDPRAPGDHDDICANCDYDSEGSPNDEDEKHFECPNCGYTWDAPALWDECPECGIEVEGSSDIEESADKGNAGKATVATAKTGEYRGGALQTDVGKHKANTNRETSTANAGTHPLKKGSKTPLAQMKGIQEAKPASDGKATIAAYNAARQADSEAKLKGMSDEERNPGQEARKKKFNGNIGEDGYQSPPTGARVRPSMKNTMSKDDGGWEIAAGSPPKIVFTCQTKTEADEYLAKMSKVSEATDKGNAGKATIATAKTGEYRGGALQTDAGKHKANANKAGAKSTAKPHPMKAGSKTPLATMESVELTEWANSNLGAYLSHIRDADIMAEFKNAGVWVEENVPLSSDNKHPRFVCESALAGIIQRALAGHSYEMAMDEFEDNIAFAQDTAGAKQIIRKVNRAAGRLEAHAKQNAMAAESVSVKKKFDVVRENGGVVDPTKPHRFATILFPSDFLHEKEDIDSSMAMLAATFGGKPMVEASDEGTFGYIYAFEAGEMDADTFVKFVDKKLNKFTPDIQLTNPIAAMESALVSMVMRYLEESKTSMDNERWRRVADKLGEAAVSKPRETYEWLKVKLNEGYPSYEECLSGIQEWDVQDDTIGDQQEAAREDAHNIILTHLAGISVDGMSGQAIVDHLIDVAEANSLLISDDEIESIVRNTFPNAFEMNEEEGLSEFNISPDDARKIFNATDVEEKRKIALEIISAADLPDELKEMERRRIEQATVMQIDDWADDNAEMSNNVHRVAEGKKDPATRIKEIKALLNKEKDASRMPGAKPYGSRRKVINLNSELDRLLRAKEVSEDAQTDAIQAIAGVVGDVSKDPNMKAKLDQEIRKNKMTGQAPKPSNGTMPSQATQNAQDANDSSQQSTPTQNGQQASTASTGGSTGSQNGSQTGTQGTQGTVAPGASVVSNVKKLTKAVSTPGFMKLK